MTHHVLIRDETAADAPAIAAVTIAAFADLAISRKTEQYVIEALRDANALTISLVAELDGRLVGHIAFSPVTISGDSKNWYGLGPVSVAPDRQRAGIGTALIQEGLCRLKAAGAGGCCLVGHPGYYERFGFRNRPELVHPGVPPEVFFALNLSDRAAAGVVTFHEGFKAEALSSMSS